MNPATEALPVATDRRCLCGVDEAGLGPVLGPLVIAGVALDGPAGTDPWDALDSVVCRSQPSDAQIQVADSKKVHQGPNGLARLERSALTFWSAWRGEVPRDLEELLTAAGVPTASLRRCPWYEGLALPLPLENPRTDLELRAHMVRRAIDRAGIALRHLAVLPIDVEEFNASLLATDNKSETHFGAYARVLADILRRAPDGAHVVADRCGGRVRYRSKLVETFPQAKVRILRETTDASTYRIAHGEAVVRVTFASRGEDRAFPTALASCLAKYVREAMLRVLNGWFGARIPTLRPTAGYFVDGHRFLADVETFLAEQALPRHLLVRAR